MGKCSSHGPDVFRELEVVSVGPEGQAMGTLHHNASIVDWPDEYLSNMIQFDK